MVTAGGFLNGLPRAGDEYRPGRVCGKGVIAEVQAAQEEKELHRLEQTAGDDALAQMHVAILKKSNLKSVPIEEQIDTRVVNLHGGGEWGQPIASIPIQLTRSPDLICLDLSSNKLSRIPDAICNMPNCKRLILDSNCLEALPQGLGALKSLTWFSCCNNMIDRVPLSFASMPVVQMADFSNNRIPILLEHAVCVSSLTTLAFFGNICSSQMPAYPGAELEDVLKMASLKRMDALTSLNLECNKLTHVPVGISALTNLKFLRLGRNNIVSLGAGGTSYPELDAEEALKQLHVLASNLIFLELHQNRIEHLPVDICLLSQLTHLDLSSNYLSEIPHQATSLVSLRTFKVDRNPLHSIPTSIASMPWLREFTTKDCGIGRVGGMVDAANGGTVGTWRRQHGPLNGKIFHHLGKYLQLDPMVLAQYERAQVGKPFDSQAGVHATITKQSSSVKLATAKGESANSVQRTPGSRHSSRHGARSAMTMQTLTEEWDDTSTEAQQLRGRQELQEAKLRYTHRKNEKYNKIGSVPLSQGEFLMSSSPLKDSLRSPNRQSASSVLESRPHVRTYLFEHQLANSMHLLEDSWNEKMDQSVGTAGRLATETSGGSSVTSRPQSHVNDASPARKVGASAVPHLQMAQEERVQFDMQIGIRMPTPPLKPFQYYHDRATTPYLPVGRLQHL
jgi:ribosomal protein L21